MPGRSHEELDNAGLVDLTISKVPSPSKPAPKCEKTPEKTINSDLNKSNESRSKKKSQSAGKIKFHDIICNKHLNIDILFQKRTLQKNRIQPTPQPKDEENENPLKSYQMN